MRAAHRLALATWILATGCFAGIDLDRLDGDEAGSACEPGPESDDTCRPTPTPTPDGAPSPHEGDSACPADMVRTAAFCIDRTEVTNAAYARFLARFPGEGEQEEEEEEEEEAGDEVCAWNTSLVPAAWPAPALDGERPVGGVDWCDARTFCEARGKRLCGAVVGAMTSAVEAIDPARSEWASACTLRGTRRFPYGDRFEPMACNGGNGPDESSGPGSGHQRASTRVGSASCEGGAPGLFDMSGNVDEWVAACEPGLGDRASDRCSALGGDYLSKGDALACTSVSSSRRDFQASTRGFRCCR